MSASYRHHRAGPDGPVVVLVPVPFESGSPKNAREVKPGSYPIQRREHWRPARAIPPRNSKAQATRRLIENIMRQDEDIRAYMAEIRRRTAQSGASQ